MRFPWQRIVEFRVRERVFFEFLYDSENESESQRVEKRNEEKGRGGERRGERGEGRREMGLGKRGERWEGGERRHRA